MPFTIAADDAPILYEETADGSLRLVRYRVRGNRYITDTLLDRAVLVIGLGQNQQRVTITRRTALTR